MTDFTKNSPGTRHGTNSRAYYATDPRENPSLKESLKGQNALITGAGRGIGREIALFFAHGSIASLTLIALESHELEETEVLVRAVSPDICVEHAVLDVTDAEAVRHVVENMAARFGSIDVWRQGGCPVT